MDFKTKDKIFFAMIVVALIGVIPGILNYCKDLNNVKIAEYDREINDHGRKINDYKEQIKIYEELGDTIKADSVRLILIIYMQQANILKYLEPIKDLDYRQISPEKQNIIATFLLNPENTQLLSNNDLSFAYYAIEDYFNAVEAFDRVIWDNQNDTIAHGLRAISLSRLSKNLNNSNLKDSLEDQAFKSLLEIHRLGNYNTKLVNLIKSETNLDSILMKKANS